MSAAIFFQTIAGFALVMAGLLQIAVIRSPDIPSRHNAKHSAIKLTCAAMLISGMHLLNMAVDGQTADKALTLALGLIGVSQSVFALIKLFPEEYQHGKN